MRIGFDAKRVFHNLRGLGNYSRTLVSGLSKHFPEDQYYLFTPKFRDKTWINGKSDLNVITPKKRLYNKFPALWRSLFLSKDISKINLDIYHG